MEISVSLDPSADKNLEQYIAEINEIGGVSFHCDFMRPPFVGRDAMSFKQYEYVMKNARHDVDVHLMANSVGEMLGAFQKTPPRSVCFHVESVPAVFDAREYLMSLKKLGIKAGLAVDLNTPAEIIDRSLLCMCDVITVMSVKAGKSGQTFNPSALEKIKSIKKIAPNARIITDGGINADNIALVKAAGADTAVIGGYLYNMPSQTQRVQAVAKLLGM